MTEGGPTLAHFGFMIAAFWLVQIGAQILLAVLSAPFTPWGHFPYFSVVWSVLAADLVLLLLIYRAFHAQHYVTWRSIGGCRPTLPLPTVMLLVLVTMAFVYFLDFAYVEWLGQEYSQDLEEVFDGLLRQRNYLSFSVLIFSTVIGAPILEEVVFRGFLQTALTKYMRPWIAVILSALIFAAVHFDLDVFPLLFVMGLLLGWLYAYTRSIWPSVALHFLNNSVAVVLLVLP